MSEADQTSNWRPVDPITISGGKIALPLNVPNEPGLYRLKFDERTYYVGQAKSIGRRLGDYHTPGQGIESDHRIHNALMKFGSAQIEIITGSEFSNISVRHQRERAEIAALRALKDVRLLNGNPDCVENLLDRIDYHKSEIEKLESQIQKMTSQTQGGNNAN